MKVLYEVVYHFKNEEVLKDLFQVISDGMIHCVQGRIISFLLDSARSLLYTQIINTNKSI